MTDAGAWSTIKQLACGDRTRMVDILRSSDGRFRYDVLRWQRYYDPSPADAGRVEGGLWGATQSGSYPTAEAAERDALAANPWLKD
jgi:hypothetical protein